MEEEDGNAALDTRDAVPELDTVARSDVVLTARSPGGEAAIRASRNGTKNKRMTPSDEVRAVPAKPIRVKRQGWTLCERRLESCA